MTLLFDPCVSLFGLPYKVAQSGGLNGRNLFSHSLEARILRSGVGRVVFFCGFSPWFVDDGLLPVSSHGHPLCMSVSKFPPVLRTLVIPD